MGVNEKTPLRGSEEHVPYVFMTDPNRAYKKRVRQLQCFICTAILGIFGLALLVSLAYSVDVEEEADEALNGSLQAGALRSGNPLKAGFPSTPLEPKPVYEKTDDAQFATRSSSKLKSSMCSMEDNLDFYCPLSKYRQVAGTCNNLNHPFSWGVGNRPMSRMLQPDYCDGTSSPRCSSSKGALPSPQAISSKLTMLQQSDGANQNIMSSLWAQFINQDLVAFTEYYLEELDESCCNSVGAADNDCYPLHISAADPLFKIYNRTCIGYRRTPSLQCPPNGLREQLNKATSFLDGSTIYGNTKEMESKLRKFVNGELVLYITENNNFLPVNKDVPFTCNSESEGFLKDCINNQGHRCLNEHVNLPSLNHIMAKQHNFIAAQLKTMNPAWSDEMLFQEARRIVAAQIQHITYNEFLKNIVDDSVMKSFGQRNAETGYYEGYDSNVDATVSNAFANAAFAMVFSFLPESEFTSSQNKTRSCNHYFISRLIQRGRDHGLPSYLKWREYCGLKTTFTMDGLVDVMSPEAVNALKELYENIEDIDLFTGVFAERLSEGNAVGPVGLCIIRDQFKRLKSGDRFWYETKEQPQSFTKEQLAEIRKSTLSRIVCDNFQETKTIQYNIMKTSLSNPTLLCSAIPSLNLSLWDDSRNILPEINEMKSDSLHNVQSSSKLKDDMATFVQSANSFIIKTSSKTTNITKKATNFMVNVMNVTATIDGKVVYEEYNKKLPITLPLDNVADTTAYTPAATVTFMGNYEDDILEGSLTLPYKDPDTFQKGKHMLQVNFVSGVTIKWAGSFDLNPKKKYACKLMFQSYNKLSNPSQSIKKEVDDNGDNDGDVQCNIMLVGTFYHRPFYCAVTPWWCSEGTIFYWSGDSKLIFTKPAIPNALNKKASQSFAAIHSSSEKDEENMKEINTFASVTVLKGKISGHFNGEDWMNIYDGSPPAILNLNNIVNPIYTDIFTHVTWQATPMEDRMIAGTFSLPYYSSIGTNVEKRELTGNFSLDITYKYGGSIGIIDPIKTYSCKVLFHSHKNSSSGDDTPALPTIKGSTPFGESCTISVIGSFNHTRLFHWTGDLVLAIKYKYDNSQPINGGDLLSPNMVKQFVIDSGPHKKSTQTNEINLLGKTENVVVEKTFASVTVLKGKISGHLNGEDWMDIFNGSPPAIVNLNNIVNPIYTDISTQITWQATPMEDRLVTGTFSLPYYSAIGMTVEKREYSGNFSFDIMYKYGGSIGIIDPTKTYTCKVLFQGHKNSLSGNETPVLPTIKGKTPFGESCTISVMGLFSQTKMLHWTGDLELALKYKYNSTDANNDNDLPNELPIPNVMKQFTLGSGSNKKLAKEKEIKLVGKTENVVIEKTFASVTVLKGKISGHFNGEDWMEIFNGSPPAIINLNNIINPIYTDTSTNVTWMATPMGDKLISGTFSLPYYSAIGMTVEKREITGNFSLDIMYKYGGSIGIIDATKTYTCKVLFQGHKNSSSSDETPALPTIKGKTPYGESCTISVIGSFNQTRMFYWSGDLILAIKNKYNSTEDVNGEDMSKELPSSNIREQFVLAVPNSVPLNQLTQKNKINLVGKTENVIVEKTFASVTVLKGKISGQFNGEEVFEVMNGNPPVTIYLDNVIDPNAFDVSLTATWKAATEEDRLIVGSFSVPYYPSLGDNTDRRKFTANFSVDVIYKYGGSIEIIDPSKTYTCKVMFQESKKSTMNENLVTIKNKTPFGESCSLTISGTFSKPSVFCYLTPWWCSKEKIFYWSGDVELAMKNKYNASETDQDGNSLKKLPSSKTFTVNSDPSVMYPGQNNYWPRHRFGGRVISGWITSDSPGLFSSAQTVWSGKLPFEIKMPVFWTPTIEDGAEISTVYSHSVSWSGTIFHSTIQGSYSFPQYHNEGALTWITGKYSFQLEPNPYISLYDHIVPGVKYNSNLHFHTLNSTDSIPFVSPSKKDPSPEDIATGIRAPIILLGKYSSNKKIFVWNGTFIADFSRTSNALTFIENKSEISEMDQYREPTSKSFTVNSDPSVIHPGPNGIWSGHRFGGQVISGWITSDSPGLFSHAKTVWSGELPFEIKLPVFWAPTVEEEAEISTVYGHSVSWSATIFHSTIKGSYSFPQYHNEGALTWITGKFSFQLEPNQYFSLYDHIVPGLKYNSNLHFRTLNSSDSTVFVNPMKKGPIQEDITNGLRAPIILLGKYTSDKKVFIWNGTFIADFSRTSSALTFIENKSKMSETVEDRKSLEKLPSSKSFTVNSDPSSLYPRQNDYWSGHRFGGRVISGWISSNSPGIFSSAQTVWSGELPFEIKMPVFWTPTIEEGAEISTDYGHTVSWSGTIFHTTIQGSYSFPQYHNGGALTWITGKYSFQLEPNPYISLYDHIVPGLKYNSNLQFHTLNSPDSFPFVNPTKKGPIQEDTTYGVRAPIILLGKYTPDKKVFIWNGTFIADFSRISNALTFIENKSKMSETDEDRKSLKKLPNTKSFTVNSDPSSLYPGQNDYVSGHRFGGRVISGWINSDAPGLFSRAQTVWSGELPFEIRMPIFWTPTIEEGAEVSTVYGHSVVWSATIFHSMIQGSFSFPQYHNGGALTWITGKYSFQLEPNPYISLYDLIVPGVKYNSNLYFHTLNSPDSFPFVNPTKKGPIQEDITYGVRAPIILLGKYSADKKAFIWNGTFIVDFSKTSKDLTYG